MSSCTYFLMIFDTNSASSQMASFFLLFATMFLLSFQNLPKVPVIESSLSKWVARARWNTYISIYVCVCWGGGGIKNVSGRQ